MTAKSPARGLLVLLALVLLSSACSSGKSTQQRPGYPPPGTWPAPPQPGYTPPAQPSLWSIFRVPLPPPPPLPGVYRPINVQALLASLPTSPCRPEEVSPGNWVGFDCSPPSVITRAALLSPQSSGFTGSALPPAVDHRADSTEGPIKDQGAVGTCTAVSLSTAMEHVLRGRSIPDPVSAIHIWSNYGVSQMGAAGDSNLDKKLASDGVWPYDAAEACQLMRSSSDSCGPAYDVTPNTGDTDPQIQAKKAKANSAALYILVGIEKLPSHDPNQIAALIAGGDDLWVAFNINRDAWKNSGMVNNVIPDYTITESTGHAVVLAGYRTVGAQRQFLIHNSWGTSWGEGGYAWISENMVRTQLRYAYRVRVADPSNPSPQPGPGSDGCPAGQAKDIITQQCGPACSSGAPPAAGVCSPVPIPGLPGLPGPQPAPTPPAGGSCPQGQAPDALSGQCLPLCQNGYPPIGGLCLPRLP